LSFCLSNTRFRILLEALSWLSGSGGLGEHSQPLKFL
jgi:hypothetical protein